MGIRCQKDVNPMFQCGIGIRWLRGITRKDIRENEGCPGKCILIKHSSINTYFQMFWF